MGEMPISLRPSSSWKTGMSFKTKILRLKITLCHFDKNERFFFTSFCLVLKQQFEEAYIYLLYIFLLSQDVWALKTQISNSLSENEGQSWSVSTKGKFCSQDHTEHFSLVIYRRMCVFTQYMTLFPSRSCGPRQHSWTSVAGMCRGAHWCLRRHL